MRETDFIVVKENMLSMLKYSKEEYKQYKSTRNIVYLQQAGEKLINVIEGYLSFVNKIRIEYFQQARGLIKEKALANLLYDARDLHRFFYHGINERLENEADELYQSVLKRIEDRIKRL